MRHVLFVRCKQQNVHTRTVHLVARMNGLEHSTLGQTPAQYNSTIKAQWVWLIGLPDTSPLQYSHVSSVTDELCMLVSVRSLVWGSSHA